MVDNIDQHQETVTLIKLFAFSIFSTLIQRLNLKVLAAASDPAINQRHFARWCVRILHFHIAIYLPFYEYSLYITPSDEYIPLQLSIKLSNKLRGMTG